MDSSEQSVPSGGVSFQNMFQPPPAYDFTRLSGIMSFVESAFSNYRFTVYRCASKFVALQKLLFTANIPYKLVLAILEGHGIADAGLNFMVTPFQLMGLIHNIYSAAERLGSFKKSALYNLKTATSVMSDFFWNVFDPHHNYSISLLELKVTFLLLCRLDESDRLIVQFYNLLYDINLSGVSKLNFEYLLRALAKLCIYVGEGHAYGMHNKSVSLEDCFSKIPNTVGMGEYQFHCLWTTTRTRFLIYANLIGLIKRIDDTKKLMHSNKCVNCGMERIMGIRFKCQECQNVSLCLKCFAIGYSFGKHVPSHRMFEMFTEDPPPKKLSHFFAKICNIFTSTNKNGEGTKDDSHSSDSATTNNTEMAASVTPKRVESINDTEMATSARNTIMGAESMAIENSIKVETSLVCLSNTASTASNVSERLQMIIDRLLQQNAKVENQIHHIKTATSAEISSFLGAHNDFLMDIINEMRSFSKLSQSLVLCPTPSSPNRSVCSEPMTTPPPPTITITSGGASANCSTLTHSINGADINRSYLDANKSDYSIKDLSTWFNPRKMSLSTPQQSDSPLDLLPELLYVDKLEAGDNTEMVDVHDTEMTNFRHLINKVKEIVDDSFSENSELAAATQNLENVVDDIVKGAEHRRNV